MPKNCFSFPFKVILVKLTVETVFMEIPLTGSANFVIPDQHVARALMGLRLLLAQVAMTTNTSMEPAVLSAALRSTWLKSDTCV